MDTLFAVRGVLFPVTGLIVTSFHGTEFHTGVAVEVVHLVVDQIDDLLAIVYRIEERLVGARHSTIGITTLDSVVMIPASRMYCALLSVPGMKRNSATS